jgi:hypothetical protein
VAHSRRHGTERRPRVRLAAATASLTLLLGALVAAGCAGTTPVVTGGSLALNQVPWCDQPYIDFQDDGKLNHPILSNWAAVKGQLGFTPYLPPTLPRGACLDFASGTIHDPIFGGLFRITYNVANVGPVAFNEAPRNAGQGGAIPTKFQCSTAASSTPSPSPTPGDTPTPNGTPTATAAPTGTPVPPLTVCQGAKGSTNVTMASSESADSLNQLFGAMQPNVDWVPQASAAPASSPSAAAHA